MPVILHASQLGASPLYGITHPTKDDTNDYSIVASRATEGNMGGQSVEGTTAFESQQSRYIPLLLHAVKASCFSTNSRVRRCASRRPKSLSMAVTRKAVRHQHFSYDFISSDGCHFLAVHKKPHVPTPKATCTYMYLYAMCVADFRTARQKKLY